MHICVGKLTIIGSDDGLSPGRRQATIWTNTGNILNLTLGDKLQWNFNRIWNIFIHEIALENVRNGGQFVEGEMDQLKLVS